MRKKDLELLGKMKRQEKADNKKSPITVQPVKNTIIFDTWWAEIAKKLNLPAYLKEVVWADFRARGLAKESTVEQFVAALALFGYKV